MESTPPLGLRHLKSERRRDTLMGVESRPAAPSRMRAAMFLSSRKLVQLSLGMVAYALAALAGLGSSSAQAGCGHRVISEKHRSIHALLVDGDVFKLAGNWRGETRPQSPGRKLPCTGATCSPEKSLPEAPALWSSSVGELWCVTIPAIHAARQDSRNLLQSQYPLRPRVGSFRIDRPPRNPRSLVVS
jgi:hypothetical protein